jgi:hypothetical protein
VPICLPVGFSRQVEVGRRVVGGAGHQTAGGAAFDAAVVANALVDLAALLNCDWSALA